MFDRSWTLRLSFPIPRGSTRSQGRPRLTLEVLEDRTAPAVLTVTNPSDHDPGSLRATIAAAETGDTILFDASLSGDAITLTSGQLLLDKDLTIEGSGNLTVSGNNASRVFDVLPGVYATLTDLTLTRGFLQASSGTVSTEANSGGAIYNAATLTLSHCTVSASNVNVLGVSVNAYGGGIANTGTLTLTDCTIAGNSAQGLGPRCYGGGISSTGTLTLCNCTVADNRLSAPEVAAAGEALGGGVYTTGSAALTNCTVAGNSATSSSFSSAAPASSAGGGIYALGGLDLSNITVTRNSTAVIAFGTRAGGGVYFRGSGAELANSMLADNTAAEAGPDAWGPFVSRGYNLIGKADGSTGWGLTDLTGTTAAPLDARLGPLTDNGGPTRTVALWAGSPALNAGDPSLLGTPDQRGVIRTGGVNIGAFQASASAFAVTAPDTVQAGMPFDVIVKAVDPFGQTAVGYTGTVTFTSADPYGATLPVDYPFVAADNGAHTFPLAGTLYTAGTWDVTATDTGTGSISAGASVSVTPAAADHLLFLQQPTDTAAGQTITPAVMVAVVDQFGNVLTDDNSDTVTLTIGTNPSGGTLSGTLTVTVSGGIATFGDLAIDLFGDGYTLHATTTGLTDTDSVAFSITV
jgi:hypothetical protein